MKFDVERPVNVDLLRAELESALPGMFKAIHFSAWGNSRGEMTVELRGDASESDVVLARKIVAEHDVEGMTGEQRREAAAWEEVRRLRRGINPDLGKWTEEDVINVLRLVWARVEGLNCAPDSSWSPVEPAPKRGKGQRG